MVPKPLALVCALAYESAPRAKGPDALLPRGPAAPIGDFQSTPTPPPCASALKVAVSTCTKLMGLEDAEGSARGDRGEEGDMAPAAATAYLVATAATAFMMITAGPPGQLPGSKGNQLLLSLLNCGLQLAAPSPPPPTPSPSPPPTPLFLRLYNSN